MKRILMALIIIGLCQGHKALSEDNGHSREGGFGGGGTQGSNKGGHKTRVRNTGTHHFGNKTAGGQNFHSNNNHSFQNNRASSNFRQGGNNHVSHLAASNVLHTDAAHSRINLPHTGPGGAALHARVITPMGHNNVVIQGHMRSITGNVAFSAQINNFNAHENIANHYYWHTWNGMNYCHYYDPWGYHWYGWYLGGSCFWTRYYWNRWWWYDPVYFRWCYWNDGGWYWQDPANAEVVYVYDNGQYVPSNGNTSTEVNSNPNPNPDAPGPAVEYPSKDGTRMVKITGGDAFLYDTGDSGVDNKPFFLASDVKEVRYSKTHNGQPLQIMVVFNDGSFKLFDSDGNPVNNGFSNNQ